MSGMGRHSLRRHWGCLGMIQLCSQHVCGRGQGQTQIGFLWKHSLWRNSQACHWSRLYTLDILYTLVTSEANRAPFFLPQGPHRPRLLHLMFEVSLPGFETPFKGVYSAQQDGTASCPIPREHDNNVVPSIITVPKSPPRPFLHRLL